MPVRQSKQGVGSAEPRQLCQLSGSACDGAVCGSAECSVSVVLCRARGRVATAGTGGCTAREAVTAQHSCPLPASLGPFSSSSTVASIC